MKSGAPRWWQAVIWHLGLLLLRLLRRTWRFRELGAPPPGARLFAFWHGDLLTLCAAPPPHATALLVSNSRDGDLGTWAALRLGYEVIRGSSSRGAVAGAAGLCRRLRRGLSGALALDGPRGPRHTIQTAAHRLARAVGVSLVPVAAAARHGLDLGSWDRMRIPAPFTRVVVIWGAPASPASSAQELDRVMMDLKRRARAELETQ